MPRYEILIRFDENTGNLKGGHFRESPVSDATPIRPEHWPAECANINNAAVASWQEISETLNQRDIAIAAYQSQITGLETQLVEISAAAKEGVSSAKSEAAAALAERDQAVSSLREHQQISDSLVSSARAAIQAGDNAALAEILHQASLFGSARESARLDAEAAALQAKLQEIAEAKSRL